VKNRLVQAIRGQTGSEVVLGKYDYNAEGLRIRHRLSERGDVDYFYDGKAVIEERNADGSLLAHYRYADRLLSLAYYELGTGNSELKSQYYHYDALGSTVNLTDIAGATQVSYNLDPWGHIKSQTGSSLNRMIFTGQEHDENTGLIYFGARFYDADTARFITQDSYLGEPGTPPSLHRYLYAYSNPTVYVDLQGHMSLENHRLTSISSLDEAVEKGYFEKPQDEAVFRRNLQIGAMIPDVQYEEVAEAYYWKAFTERLPFADKIRNLRETVSKYKEIMFDGAKVIVNKIAPETYLTLETGKHAWDDSDFRKPIIEKVAEIVPEVKDVDIVRTHFYDKQWQHGMGEDTETIRDVIVNESVKSIITYKKYVEKGETAKAAQELGIVLHYVEDSWTPSHVARDDEGKIKYMYDYTKQSPKLHAEQDKADHDSATIRNATSAGVELLEIIKEHGDNPKELRKQLMEKIYPLDYDRNYQNPYSPRAFKQDAIDAWNNYKRLPAK
jgi:RHS repeat-associated protein